MFHICGAYFKEDIYKTKFVHIVTEGTAEEKNLKADADYSGRYRGEDVSRH